MRIAFLSFILAAFLLACTEPKGELDLQESWIDLSARDKPDVIIETPWHSAVISAPNIDDMARLWIEIGGYETVMRDADNLVLRAAGTQDGYVHIIRNNAPDAMPARPLDARAWDTGCYWSLMMRAKDIASIIEDARDLGWELLTEIAFLEFGPSKLNIIVLRHQLTGTQVQLYERLTTPLPDGFPDFERLSRPFNIMQMVDSQAKSFDVFQQGFGFETFHYGAPVTSPVPVINPLGIPKDLTPKIPYKAAIVTPKKGLEWGRFEMIEIEGMTDGRDFSNRCHRGNWGLLEVNIMVDDVFFAVEVLTQRGLKIHAVDDLGVVYKAPDGANLRLRGQSLNP